jgi:hypothetical protein
MAKVETEKKSERVHSRDLELLKIQSLDGYFQTKVNAAYTYAYGIFVGFAFTLITLYYNKVFDIFGNVGANLFLFIAITSIIAYLIKRYFLEPAKKLHKEYLTKIDILIMRIDRGEPLESLSELKEMVKDKQKKKHWWQFYLSLCTIPS